MYFKYSLIINPHIFSLQRDVKQNSSAPAQYWKQAIIWKKFPKATNELLQTVRFAEPAVVRRADEGLASLRDRDNIFEI